MKDNEELKRFIFKRIEELKQINCKNKSDRQLSRELGYSASYLSTLPSSKNAPLIETIANICDYFEISLSDFFKEDFKSGKSANNLYKEIDKIIDPEDVEPLLKIVRAIDKNNIKELIELFEKYSKN